MLAVVTPIPAAGVDNSNDLPVGIGEPLHMARLVMVFPAINAFLLALEKGGEVHQGNRHVFQSESAQFQ